MRVLRRNRTVLRRLRSVRVRVTIRLSYSFGEPRTVVRNLTVKAR